MKEEEEGVEEIGKEEGSILWAEEEEEEEEEEVFIILVDEEEEEAEVEKEAEVKPIFSRFDDDVGKYDSIVKNIL